MKEHDVLRGQLDRMLLELEDLSTGTHANQIKEMEQVKMFAGMTKLTGSGVVTLKDSNISRITENPNLYIVHDEDILRVVNEPSGGAEAKLLMSNVS